MPDIVIYPAGWIAIAVIVFGFAWIFLLSDGHRLFPDTPIWNLSPEEREQQLRAQDAEINAFLGIGSMR